MFDCLWLRSVIDSDLNVYVRNREKNAGIMEGKKYSSLLARRCQHEGPGEIHGSRVQLGPSLLELTGLVQMFVHFYE